MKRLNKRAITGFMLVVALLLSLITPVWGQTPITRMGTVIIKTLTVTNGLTSDDLTATDDIVAGDDATVTDDLTVTDAANVSDLILTPATSITVTMNATITPGGSYQPLTSAGTVNTSSITVLPAGEVLTLVNNSNTSIVFTDTGTLKLSGNITLGQYDSLTLRSDGTNYIQLSTSNN